MSMKTVSAKQIQKLDRVAINQYGVPSLALMENAGKSCAFEVLKMVKSKRKPRVSIFCGLGNNAGDGFVVARHLINANVDVRVFLIGRAVKLKNDAAVNYRILKKCKYKIQEIRKVTTQALRDIRKSDVLVDAIFGVGLSRDIQDPFKSVIEALNASKKRVIAIDVPSGLDATTGRIYQICVKASKTVTFSFAKRGFIRQQGPKYTGKVIIVDIGIPRKLMERI